jgi:hypothetical protein
MKKFNVLSRIDNYKYHNQIECEYIKVELNSIVCYIDGKVVAVFPSESTYVISKDLKTEPIN